MFLTAVSPPSASSSPPELDGHRVARPQRDPDASSARSDRIQRHERLALVAFPDPPAARVRRYGWPHRMTQASRTGGTSRRCKLRSEMSAVPALPPLSPARRIAAAPCAARSACASPSGPARWWRSASCSPAASTSSSLTAGRRRVGLDRRLARCSTSRRSRGKAIVWKAALDALPGRRPVRYGHVVPALFIGFLLNTVLFARVGELARVAVLARRRRLAGRTFPRARSRARRSPSSSCSASRSRSRWSRSHRSCTCRT